MRGDRPSRRGAASRGRQQSWGAGGPTGAAGAAPAAPAAGPSGGPTCAGPAAAGRAPAPRAAGRTGSSGWAGPARRPTRAPPGAPSSRAAARTARPGCAAAPQGKGRGGGGGRRRVRAQGAAAPVRAPLRSPGSSSSSSRPAPGHAALGHQMRSKRSRQQGEAGARCGAPGSRPEGVWRQRAQHPLIWRSAQVLQRPEQHRRVRAAPPPVHAAPDVAGQGHQQLRRPGVRLPQLHQPRLVAQAAPGLRRAWGSACLTAELWLARLTRWLQAWSSAQRRPRRKSDRPAAPQAARSPACPPPRSAP
jgi:hypothetical protein